MSRSSGYEQLPNKKVLDAVDKIFASKPLHYNLHPDHSDSTQTRDPGSYDLHMAPELQLKNIALVNNLPLSLSMVPDFASKSISTQGKFPHDIPNSALESLSKALLPAPKILNENGLAKDYTRRTANPCLPIAGGLLSGGAWSNVFQWSVDSTINAKSGQCDGCLSINDIPENDTEVARLFKKHLFDRLVLWEFKSLVAGDWKTMKQITELAEHGTFTWMTCNSKHFGHLRHCESPTKHSKDGILSVTGRRTGPDAKSGPQPEDFERHIQTRFGLKPGKKAYFIIQQVWAELVKEDATFAVISSGDYEIIVKRHRATQTLYVSNILYPSETATRDNPPHYKVHTGLYMAGYIDAVDRVRQLEDISSLHTAPRDNPEWLSRYSRSYSSDTAKYSLPGFLQPPKLTPKQREEAMNLMKSATEDLLDHLKVVDAIKIRFNKNILPDQEMHIFQRLSLDEQQAERAIDGFGEQDDIGHEDDQDEDDQDHTRQVHEGDENDQDYQDYQDLQFGSQPESQATDYDDPVDLQINVSNADMSRSAISTVGRASLTRYFATGDTPAYFNGLFIKVALQANKKKDLRKEYAVYRQLCQNGASCVLPVYGLFRSVNPGLQFDVLVMKYGGESLSCLLQRADYSDDRKAELRREVYQVAQNLHSHRFVHNGMISDHVLIDFPTRNSTSRKISLCSFGAVSRLHPELTPAALEKARRNDLTAIRLALKSTNKG